MSHPTFYQQEKRKSGYSGDYVAVPPYPHVSSKTVIRLTGKSSVFFINKLFFGGLLVLRKGL